MIAAYSCGTAPDFDRLPPRGSLASGLRDTAAPLIQLCVGRYHHFTIATKRIDARWYDHLVWPPRRDAVPWCHTCRIEYPVDLDACPECDRPLVDAPAPERRVYAGAESGLVVVAVLPPEQALVASDRLDRDGIPSALRDVGSDGGSLDPTAVRVLVQPTRLAEARRVLRGRSRTGGSLMMFLLLVTAIAVFLSGAIVVVRWFLTGSPVPGG